MGVTLERVQNKFACIIGELCSEPVVLSQFAIWLDLRLAEYKAKGAISLECSGEKPDPVWLKGHKDEPVRVHKREITQAQSRSAAHGNSFPLGNISQSDSSRFSSSEDRLSPDIVVVKEEPSDSVTETDSCIYPISLHKSSNRSPSRTLNRKRPAETLSSPHNASKSNNTSYHFHSQSPSSLPHSPKVVCHGATSSFSDNSHASNQSLMSIISGGQSQQDLDNLATNVLTDYGTLEEQGGDNSMTFQGSPLASTSRIEDESGFGIGQMEAQESGKSVYLDTVAYPDKGACSQSAPQNTTAIMAPKAPDFSTPDQNIPVSLLGASRQSENEYRRSLIKNLDQLPRQSVTNMVSAVGVFERWLWSPPCVDYRTVNEIPPKDLDNYLAEFYKSVKTPSGGEYKLSSFRTLRDGIERYLKETGYSICLKTSRLFDNSRGVHYLEYKAKKSKETA